VSVADNSVPSATAKARTKRPSWGSVLYRYSKVSRTFQDTRARAPCSGRYRKTMEGRRTARNLADSSRLPKRVPQRAVAARSVRNAMSAFLRNPHDRLPGYNGCRRLPHLGIWRTSRADAIRRLSCGPPCWPGEWHRLLRSGQGDGRSPAPWRVAVSRTKALTRRRLTLADAALNRLAHRKRAIAVRFAHRQDPTCHRSFQTSQQGPRGTF
jgi:hypothetical protein